jgi:hypothetical protein
MTEKYTFKKFKSNIFILYYNDGIISFSKIIKLPITIINSTHNYSTENNNNIIVKKSEYKEYFEEITDIFYFDNIVLSKNLYLHLSDKNIDIEINLFDLINKEILSKSIFINYYIDFYSKDLKYSVIDKILFILEDYNEYKVTLSEYLNEIKISEKINVIKYVMEILNTLKININFVHGDLKLNNILFDLTNEKISFIDLEFTYFLQNNNNKLIAINEIENINLYLKFDKNRYIKNNFLYLFDIYIFTFSLFILKPYSYNKFFHIFLKKYIEENDYSEYNNNFYKFIIIFELLLKYCLDHTKVLHLLNNNDFHKYCSLKYIFMIVYQHIKTIKYEKLDNVINDIIDCF